MGVSVFIARIYGICCLVVAIGIMFNREFYQRVMSDYSKNAALVFFGGVSALVIGTMIVLVHNVWEADWTVVITVIGWIALVKGVWLLVFPDTVSKIMRVYQENKSLLLVQSVAALIFGAFLTYMGYFAG